MGATGSLALREDVEWLEADGLGGFASGTAIGARTRRYHALLLVATAPPSGRVVLVNGLDAEVETQAGCFALSTQRYAPDVLHPDGATRLARFTVDPWPRWSWALPDGSEIEHELFVRHGTGETALRWRRARGSGPARLRVRPFLSGRDYHALHHENPAFRFAVAREGERLVLRPYDGLPAIVIRTNAHFDVRPDWYRRFRYAAETARGLDDVEDLAMPGVLELDLAREDAIVLLEAERDGARTAGAGASARDAFERLREAESARRAAFATPLDRAADAYVVARGDGLTIVAGYPWFTDWGRDTFIALRGLLIATGRLDDARRVLVEWASTVSEGMLPNRFPDGAGAPEYNAVDASLFFVVAVHEWLEAMGRARRRVAAGDRRALQQATSAILEGYEKGTRHGIRCDADGLLAAGEPGVQLTWMDAKVGDRVVTPRHGKPVEVQALWWNALRIAGTWDERWTALAERARASFLARFWDDARGMLADVVDPPGRPGERDLALRPNQTFAVGGLPFALLDGERARRVVDLVESRLFVPLGLRSLAPGEPGYVARYEGGVAERDGAYHQGTVWPWLLGPFVEAWLRVHGDDAAAREAARARFLGALVAHAREAGVGHVSEIADAEAPHVARGCPFQAWSLGEWLRLDRVVLARDAGRTPR